MKTRALVIYDDVWHPAATVRRGLEPLCPAGFEFEFVEGDPRRPTARMSEFSLVVLTKANMISAIDQGPWLTTEALTSLRNHLRRGGGLVAIHAGTSRYESSAEMKEMIGGAFGRHPDSCAVTLEPQSGHPLAEGVAQFTVVDEHYFMEMSGAPVDVFLRSRSEHGLQPAGWTRTSEGGGRICVLTPGHNLEVWLHPEFQKLLLNAFRWAKLN